MLECSKLTAVKKVRVTNFLLPDIKNSLYRFSAVLIVG